MNVLVVEPGFLPYEKEINGLAEMQKTVGGLIQAIYPFQEEVALVCNENGIFEGLEFNRSIPERSYGGVFGTFFVCGLGDSGIIPAWKATPKCGSPVLLPSGNGLCQQWGTG